MKKSKLALYILPLIFLIAFNAIFFIIGGASHPVSVWMAYGAVHLSYLLFVATPFFTEKDRHAMETGAPVAVLSFANFALHFALSLIVFLIAPTGYRALLVIYILLFAVYLVLFFVLLFANSHTEAQTKRQNEEAFYIQNLASKVKMLIERTPDRALSRRIETVYDNLRTSPTRSIAEVAHLEADISSEVAALENAVRGDSTETARDAVNNLLYLIEERNRVLKNNYR